MTVAIAKARAAGAPGRPKPGGIPAGDRLTYPSAEGSAQPPGRPKPGGIPAGDRLTYPSAQGPT